VQLHGPSALLPRKEFSEFVSFNYKYPIAISQSFTSEKYIALFYFSYLYIKTLSTLTNSLFLLFLILSYVITKMSPTIKIIFYFRLNFKNKFNVFFRYLFGLLPK